MNTKLASALGLLMTKARRAYQTGGFRAAIDSAALSRSPQHQFNRVAGEVSQVNVPDYLKGPASLNRGLAHSVGNTASNIASLLSGTDGQGVLQGAGTILKNVGKTWKSQISGDLTKEVILGGKNEVVMKNGKKFLKSQVSWMGDRELIGETNRGSVLIRKRMGIRPISVAAGISGPVAAATAYALPEQGHTGLKRVGQAAKEGAIYTASLPGGIAYTTYRSFKRKPEVIFKQKKTNNLGEY